MGQSRVVMVKYDKRAELRYAVLAAGMRRTQYWRTSLILTTEHLSLGAAIHGRAYMAYTKRHLLLGLFHTGDQAQRLS
jgi:hypothetical protein